MLTTHLLTIVCVTLGGLWLTLSCWVLVDRAGFDRRDRLTRTDAARLAQGQRLGGRRLRRIARSGLGAPAVLAARALVDRQHDALMRAAARTGSGAARLRALEIFALTGSDEAVGLLAAALREPSPTLTAAAVGLAAEIDSPAADALLLEVLIEGRHPRSRTATELEARAPRLRTELVALAEDSDAVLRYWALTLLARAPIDEGVQESACRHTGDGDPRVRGAAVRLLGRSDDPRVLDPVRLLLDDEVFYVRAHAARSIGALGGVRFAGEVAELLGDANWWVRAAARSTLVALGPAGAAAALDTLESADRFARDGARDVIQRWNGHGPKAQVPAPGSPSPALPGRLPVLEEPVGPRR